MSLMEQLLMLSSLSSLLQVVLGVCSLEKLGVWGGRLGSINGHQAETICDLECICRHLLLRLKLLMVLLQAEAICELLSRLCLEHWGKLRSWSLRDRRLVLGLLQCLLSEVRCQLRMLLVEVSCRILKAMQ